MTRAFELVRGELLIDGPGASRVPVRLVGRGDSLRVELGRGWSGLVHAIHLLPIRLLQRWLVREGITLSLVIHGTKVVEFGDTLSGARRIHPFAALRALRGTPLRHYVAVFRAGRHVLGSLRRTDR